MLLYCKECRKLIKDCGHDAEYHAAVEVHEWYPLSRVAILLGELRLYPVPYREERAPVSYQTVWNWIQRNEFPNAYKDQNTQGRGGAWRIPIADLIGFHHRLAHLRGLD